MSVFTNVKGWLLATLFSSLVSDSKSDRNDQNSKAHKFYGFKKNKHTVDGVQWDFIFTQTDGKSEVRQKAPNLSKYKVKQFPNWRVVAMIPETNKKGKDQRKMDYSRAVLVNGEGQLAIAYNRSHIESVMPSRRKNRTGHFYPVNFDNNYNRTGDLKTDHPLLAGRVYYPESGTHYPAILYINNGPVQGKKKKKPGKRSYWTYQFEVWWELANITFNRVLRSADGENIFAWLSHNKNADRVLMHKKRMGNKRVILYNASLPFKSATVARDGAHITATFYDASLNDPAKRHVYKWDKDLNMVGNCSLNKRVAHPEAGVNQSLPEALFYDLFYNDKQGEYTIPGQWNGTDPVFYILDDNFTKAGYREARYRDGAFAWTDIDDRRRGNDRIHTIYWPVDRSKNTSSKYKKNGRPVHVRFKSNGYPTGDNQCVRFKKDRELNFSDLCHSAPYIQTYLTYDSDNVNSSNVTAFSGEYHNYTTRFIEERYKRNDYHLDAVDTCNSKQEENEVFDRRIVRQIFTGEGGDTSKLYTTLTYTGLVLLTAFIVYLVYQAVKYAGVRKTGMDSPAQVRLSRMKEKMREKNMTPLEAGTVNEINNSTAAPQVYTGNTAV